LGRLSPAVPSRRTTKSDELLRRSAEITPSGIAMISDITIERNASSSVMGSLPDRFSTMGCPVRSERPRSPRTMSASQVKYWT